MATKKSSTKPAAKKQTIIKIAETIGMVAGEISVKKDQVVEMAVNALEVVKDKLLANKQPEKKNKIKAKPVLKESKQKTTVKKPSAEFAKIGAKKSAKENKNEKVATAPAKKVGKKKSVKPIAPVKPAALKTTPAKKGPAIKKPATKSIKKASKKN